MKLKWKLILVVLETKLILTLDLFMVCNDLYHWIESHFWMELLGDEDQEQARFGPFGNSVSVGAI